MKKVQSPEAARAAKIKDVVRGNFDASPEAYGRFEEEYGYFASRAKELSDFCGVEPDMRVMDIGCGTGISSLVLADVVGPNGVVIGLDISDEMIALANEERKKRKAFNVQFVNCDAQDAVQKMDMVFDGALFNASIFLIPMTQNVLMAAADCIRPGGKVGFNFLRYDLRQDGKYYSMLSEMNRPEPGPVIWDREDLNVIFNTVGLLKIKNDIKRTSYSLDIIKRFYLIPAMSASLFPKLEYPERRKRVKAVFQDLSDKGVLEIEQEWERYYCVKPGMAI